MTIGFFSDSYYKTGFVLPIKKNRILKFHDPEIAYYYIDDVILTELKEGEKCSCEQTDSIQPPTVKTQIVPSVYDSAVGKAMVLQNINFELNKATLLPSSYEELNKLVTYLQKNANYKLELNGYTDNVGKETDNLKLSEDRAKAVADYLIQRGIVQARISYKGYGSGKPIADNKREEGRASNRRVEIIFK